MGKGQHNIGADHADRWRKNAGKRRRRWRPEYLFALVLVPLAVFLAFNADTLGIGPSLAPVGLIDGTSTEGAGSSGSCEIKGNINIDSGERIYHVPGQEHYLETIIRPEYGERWFCSEEEALAAGWRKARR